MQNRSYLLYSFLILSMNFSLSSMELAPSNSLSRKETQECLDTLKTTLALNTEIDEEITNQIMQDLNVELMADHGLYSQYSSLETTLIKNCVNDTLQRYNCGNLHELISFIFDEAIEPVSAPKRKADDKDKVSQPENKQQKTEIPTDEQLYIQPILINQQNDGFSCGYQAIAGAAAISQIAQKNPIVKFDKVKTEQKIIVEKLLDTGKKAMLNNHDIYQHADTLSLPHCYIFGPQQKQKNKITILAGEKSRLFNVTHLDTLFADIKKHGKPHTYHFIYNQDAIHWVLFSVVVRNPETMYIFFVDSFNQNYTENDGTYNFSRKLLQSLSEGANYLVKTAQSSKDVITLD